jgi:hypothetical protein
VSSQKYQSEKDYFNILKKLLQLAKAVTVGFFGKTEIAF